MQRRPAAEDVRSAHGKTDAAGAGHGTRRAPLSQRVAARRAAVGRAVGVDPAAAAPASGTALRQTAGARAQAAKEDGPGRRRSQTAPLRQLPSFVQTGQFCAVFPHSAVIFFQ